MAIEVISIGSSSSGNSYIIMAGSRTILLDVGLTAKKILGALEHFDIAPEEVNAVLVTHEHVDHVKSVRAISRKCCNAVFYTSQGTYDNTANFVYVPGERLQIVAAGDAVALNAPCSEGIEEIAASADNENNEALTGTKAEDDVVIGVFPLSHDACEPVGFTVSCGGEKLAVVTDTGIITEEIFEAIKDADKLVFESNHDEHLLMFGEYPYYVKQRIKSEHGHLANDYAGCMLSRILSEKYETAFPGTGIFKEDPAESLFEKDPAESLFEKDSAESLFENLDPNEAVSIAFDRNTSGAFKPELVDNSKQGKDAGEPDPSTIASEPAAKEGTKPVSIMLAHLSENNNLPLYALQAVELELKESGFERGVHYLLSIAAKETLTIMK